MPKAQPKSDELHQMSPRQDAKPKLAMNDQAPGSPTRSPARRFDRAEVMADYRLAYLSRQASLIGRKEVLTGKAKFGIFGDGKELAQIAMAKAFRAGDWRSGYYRDQTFMLAIGATDLKKFFAQLYADTDLQNEPASGGRQMNAHYATRFIDGEGNWLDQTQRPNSAADLSPTAAQMSRLVGLGYASKLYRNNPALHEMTSFSRQGNEVAFGTIGNASTSEGVFWEAINAIGVLQVPVAVSVWDDGYGISVPNRYQTTKESISAALAGFAADESQPGLDIYVVPGWDYPRLVEAYEKAIAKTRRDHTPCLLHIVELTQPQGHSSSGSHERYKSAERLAFEVEFDCLRKMRAFILEGKMATAEELDELEKSCLAEVEKARQDAWNEQAAPIEKDRDVLIALYESLAREEALAAQMQEEIKNLRRTPSLQRRVLAASARRALYGLSGKHDGAELKDFVRDYMQTNQSRYSRWLTVEGARSPLGVAEVPAVFAADAEKLMGFEIIQKHWDHLMGRDPRVFIVGEDVGVLGCVNQSFKGLQEKYGEIRITDTGIREATIFGQGLGAAMRGLRPIVDIQYLDYLLYCFQLMSDDLASLHFRSAGGQLAPVIVRTKGHRLEGIWHSGSPMGTIIHGIRGMHVCVPRNMVQAVGLYNTLVQGDDPALVIEVLNGYRLREAVPENLHEFTIPLGVPEVVLEGHDLTLVTYGACVRVAEEAAKFLATLGIALEVIDVRTLLPYDLPDLIGTSIRKTGAVLFLDEDVPGGASSYMMQQTLERGAYDWLDAMPRTLTGQAHRPGYASDADYWSKPSAEDVIDIVYAMLHERDPERFPAVGR